MAPKTPSRARRPVVICVDDEERTLRALTRLFRDEPFELRTTPLPAEVLTWIDEGGIDLVIADERMPGMTGTEVLDAVRKRSPETARLILTAYPDSVPAAARRNGTVHALLTKPWDERTLRDAVNRVLLRPPPARETYRVDCRGKSAERAFLELTSDLDESPRSVVLILDRLELLEDSVARLIKSIGRRMLELGKEGQVIDRSGLVRTFSDATRRSFPLNTGH